MAKQKIFGLDISDHSVEAILLNKKFAQTKVVAYSRTILRQELVVNGVIKKPSQLSEKIRQLLASAKPKAITTPYCIVSIPDSQVFTYVFKFPAGLKREEIKNTIPYKAEEIIPFRTSEVYFDFKTINVSNGSQEVFYAAVPTKIVDSYVEVIEAAGLIPIAFELESISLSRAVLIPAQDTKKGNKKQPAQALLLLDIGARTANINILDHNGLRLNSLVKIAGNRFTKTLVTNLKITEKQAGELKMKVGFNLNGGNNQATKLLQQEAQKIIKEVKKVIDYYYQETGSQVSNVLLAGGSSLLPGIDKYFSEQLGLTVSLGNALRKVSDPIKLLQIKNKSLLFANVIGLALRGLDKRPSHFDVNLLPLKKRRFELAPDKRDKKAWRQVYVRVAVFVLLAVVLIALILLRQKGYDLYQKFFVTPQYETSVSDQGINDQAINQLLEEPVLNNINLDQATSTSQTATTTQEIVEQPKLEIKIRSTALGYLNVRSGPGTNFGQIGRVDSGSVFVVLDQQNGWYQIQYSIDKSGWISGQYVDKL